MLQQLDYRHAELKLEMNKRDKVLRRQKALQEQLEETGRRTELYCRKLQKETKDVDKLDRFSFLNMFRTWTGKQDEIRLKELSEMTAAEAKWREAEKMEEALQVDLVDIQTELNNPYWQDIDERWQAIIKEKEDWIFKNNLPECHTLGGLYEEHTLLTTLQREMEEALKAGGVAKRSLQFALKRLDSAKGYSTWDTFLGGGFIATVLKHGELDDAENAIHKAQVALQTFQTELLDVKEVQAESLQVERGSFITFADYVFDDIFSEWSLHSRIKSSQEHVERTLNQVIVTCGELEHRLVMIEKKVKQIQQEIDAILE
ncbi:hypothetical protein JFL43_17575 [Viridibacillus sp. YIM B01967]|uniref:Uncharacterized protein n=1 Tax=Viridibacillus soli TaxID=2798301 RepID=A0ABS1HB08_9BACL|nr:hypothetical protein [Viridibacillus soli]MBK3496636.1 hypothetical protein [Viridibacillus soli]